MRSSPAPPPLRARPDVAPSVAASRATSPDGGGCEERDVEDAVPYRCRDLLHLFSLSAPAVVIRRAEADAEFALATRRLYTNRLRLPLRTLAYAERLATPKLSGG